MIQNQCIAIVDPLSTGACVAAEAYARGYPLIAVWDKDLTATTKKLIPEIAKHVKYFAEVDEKATIKDTADALRSAAGTKELCAVIVGSEPGVLLADALSETLGLRTNGVSNGRRDKKVQQELVRKAGLRSVRQAGGTKVADIEEFLSSEPMPVVVKPCESAGSDGVKLCATVQDAKDHFNLLMGSQRAVGSQGAAVLCQEFLKGKEYVVDHVSRDGVHKCTMVWVYDKREANDAAFVYYGTLPVPVDSKEAQQIIPYVQGVLDALGVANGPSHGEVMMTQRGPVLVEMNCRAHGGEGSWIPLAMELTGGHTQVNGAIEAFMDEAAFAKIPALPPCPFKATGQQVTLVSYEIGIVTAVPGYDKIRKMESFVFMDTPVEVGSKIELTIDVFTGVGNVVLMHHDAEMLRKDVAAIRRMETDRTIFELAPIINTLGTKSDFSLMIGRGRGASSVKDATPASCRGSKSIRHAKSFSVDFMPPPRAFTKSEIIVIVDPLSTGACVALEAASRGYPLIAVWDKDLTEETKLMVPHAAKELQYFAHVDERDTVKETAEAVRKAAGEYKVGACIVGAEMGVQLADALSTELKLLSNGISDGRRDKKRQQELVKAKGLRSVRQAGGTKISDVKEFLAAESMPVVVKPCESAGSEGVKLCNSIKEAEDHFDLLMNSQRKVGSANAMVLCQEFLKGKEYVVDNVSLNGEHKVTMVWVYDKRQANGAAFVYYGLLPVDVNSPEAQLMIPYIHGVLDALGIKHGPTHGEIMMTQKGPCLVEMNCRAHGGEGSWIPLAMELTGGFTQVNGCIDAFMDEKAFAKIPKFPPSPYNATGLNVMMVSYYTGTISATPGFAKIRTMESFVSMETALEIGSSVELTVDVFTTPAQVILMHHDAETLQKDIDTIRQMENDNTLFEYEDKAILMGRPRARSDFAYPDK